MAFPIKENTQIYYNVLSSFLSMLTQKGSLFNIDPGSLRGKANFHRRVKNRPFDAIVG